MHLNLLSWTVYGQLVGSLIFHCHSAGSWLCYTPDQSIHDNTLFYALCYCLSNPSICEGQVLSRFPFLIPIDLLEISEFSQMYKGQEILLIGALPLVIACFQAIISLFGIVRNILLQLSLTLRMSTMSQLTPLLSILVITKPSVHTNMLHWLFIVSL